MTKFSLIFLIGLSIGVSAGAQEDQPMYQQAPSEPQGAVPKESGTGIKGAIRMARVYFISPKDGETVGREFTVKFGVEGMQVKPAAGTAAVGEGHHHLIINSPALKKGEFVPSDDKHLHFGKGETETKVKLKPGEHTLTLQFADGMHRAYGEMMTQTIKVTVK